MICPEKNDDGKKERIDFEVSMSSDEDTTLVLATLSNLDPHFLEPVVSFAAASTRRRLTIVLFSRLFGASLSHTEQWDDVQRLLTVVYVQATKIAQDMDKVLMEVDVLLKGLDEDVQDDLGVGVGVCFRVEGGE